MIKRVMFYSHDTFGLGHIRRTQKLANIISSPERSILIACSSPKASAFVSPPGIEYLNLPGFTKQLSGEYVPRSLNLPIEDFVQLRASLLLSAVRAFSPEIFIVDKEPLGVKRELLPALDFLKGAKKKCRIVCGFRDILDEPETVAKEWYKRDTSRILDHYYDDVLVYGDAKIFDFAKNYGVSPAVEKKITYTGYIHPRENLNLNRLNFGFPEAELPLVTLTLGGGGDGADILQMLLPSLETQTLPFNLLLITGPFASAALVKKASDVSERNPRFQSVDFVPNTQTLFSRSDLVVSMGGYNTMTELTALHKYALILPRVLPRQEQLIRAQMFKRLGYCDYLHPDEMTAETLVQKIQQLLGEKRETPAFPSTGLDKFREWIEAQ